MFAFVAGMTDTPLVVSANVGDLFRAAGSLVAGGRH
jgi:hypothetical protein